MDEIWKAYHSKLHRFILSRVSDRAAGDDILQEVFLKVHKEIGRLKDRTKLPSWLYRITRNAIIDHYRRRKETTELPEDLMSVEPEDQIEAVKELSKCMRPMAEALPPVYREAFVLSEMQGLTLRDVAAKQGISLSGAKSRVQRARGLVKKKILACCRVELDHQGGVMDFAPRRNRCDG